MRLILIAIIILLSFGGCEKSINYIPPANNVDSCGNSKPLTAQDSASDYWWFSIWRTNDLSFSPDRNYFATEIFTEKPYRTGISIYDVIKKQPKYFLSSGFTPVWSPDGNYLIYISGGSNQPFIFNVNNNELKKISSLTYIVDLAWDQTSQYIYMTRSGYDRYEPFPFNKAGTFRIKQDGTNLEWISDKIYSPQIITNDSIICFDNSSTKLIRYNISKQIFQYDSLIGYSGNSLFVRHIRISPDKRYLIFDRFPIDYKFAYGGLWILDLSTLQSRQVLPEQMTTSEVYYPRWYSNNELICSFHCRKDTAITTWFVDLSGKVIKQITHKGMTIFP